MSESSITRYIVSKFSEEFLELTDVDVAIVGAGPSGITAARYLAKAGARTVVFERNMYVGGGMWGGGILFPKIVVEESAKLLLDEVNLKMDKVAEGYYVADSVEAVSKCTSAAISAGAKIWVGMSVEDVAVRKTGKNIRVCGVVINWHAVEKAGFHVDPVTVLSKLVIDATGHEANVVRTLTRKMPEIKLPTSTGGIVGEKPMWAELAEAEIMKNTREILPGLLVTGMTANTVFGSYRMGPLFGGMFLSGKKAAEHALKKLKQSK